MKLLKCNRCKKDYHWSMMYSLNALKGTKYSPDDEIYCTGCRHKLTKKSRYIKKENRYSHKSFLEGGVKL